MSRSFAAPVYDVGPPMTLDPRNNQATLAAFGAANRCQYGRVGTGGTITGIMIDVGTSSGNISVAVYRNTGTGSAARPGTRVATSGAVACPATGNQTVSLGGSVTVQPGDWFGFSCDNTTATFRRQTNTGMNPLSLLGQEASAHPAPATATAAATGATYMLVGV